MKKMASGKRKRTVFIPDPRIDATKYVIPFIYEKNRWSTGETFRVRVSNVYDPSKFWIVGIDTKLASFQTSMLQFYLKNGSQYKMRSAFVKKNTYCISCVNSAYFRAIILNKPFGMERKVPVFFIDFGFHMNVKPTSFYHFHESYFEVPRFGVRARLPTLKPYKGESWTHRCVKQFQTLVTDEILTITIGHIDPVEKAVYISPQMDPNVIGSFAGIAKNLLDRKLAKKENVDMSIMAVCQNPHLLPIFDTIESGATPTTPKISGKVEKVNRKPSKPAMVKINFKKEKK